MMSERQKSDSMFLWLMSVSHLQLAPAPSCLSMRSTAIASWRSRSIGWLACTHDLDPNATRYIIADSINPKEMRYRDYSAMQKLQGELIRYLASTLPSIAFKTGDTTFFGLEAPVSLCAIRTPVVFLDMRRRHFIDAANRSEFIRQAIENTDVERRALYARGLTDLTLHGYGKTCMNNLVCCEIAYFHDVLFDDGEYRTAGINLYGEERSRLLPLHEALSLARKGASTAANKGLSRFKEQAMGDQVLLVANMLADRYYRDRYIHAPFWDWHRYTQEHIRAAVPMALDDTTTEYLHFFS